MLAVPVMHSRLPVHAYADTDIHRLECVKHFVAEEGAVSLYPTIYADWCIDGNTNRPQGVDHWICSTEQRLATVEDDPNGLKIMIAGMFGYTRGHDRDEWRRHDLRPSSPCLIRVLVYVTVITG